MISRLDWMLVARYWPKQSVILQNAAL